MRGTRVNGIPGLLCHTVSGAMSLVTAAAELTYHIIGVDTRVQPLTISPSQRLDDVVRTLNATGGGGTNLALPMEYALEKGMDVDAFIIYTDSETWAGSQHPVVALQKYRDRTGIPSKVINVQMASTRTTNNDPGDALALEMVGFDTTAPQIISEFIGGAW
jgi:60 kDa SS-A/Ro ribonucleoprotein